MIGVCVCLQPAQMVDEILTQDEMEDDVDGDVRSSPSFQSGGGGRRLWSMEAGRALIRLLVGLLSICTTFISIESYS